MLNKTLFTAALCGLAVTAAAVAQTPGPHSTPPEPFRYMTAKEVNALTDKPGPGSKTNIVSDHENFFVEYVTRGDAGNIAEVHAHWIDYFHILSGTGTLSWGGTVSGGKQTAPGEIRGGTITGGKTQALHPGDYVQIPAGTPHLTTASPGGKISYIVFKGRL